MEFIHDEALLEKILEQEGIREHFENRFQDFRLLRWEKGGILCAPDRPLRELLFVVRGSVRVYTLREDGSCISISRGIGPTTLGTMEFVRRDLPSFYAEAVEDVLCVALSLEKNRAALEGDRTFLRYVLNGMAEMIITFTLIGQSQQSLEEKVLTFLRDIQPEHTLYGINNGLLQFHCSRRQLQRVVKKLCQDGALEKTGRGEYRLI